MSCNYADGLSPYVDKGVVGIPEKFESPESVEAKCEILSNWIREARHVVVHTGAGISTAAGIPDFRGPNGVWTLERKGLKPTISTSFNEAIPTKTHMALKKLIDEDYVKFIVSQNIDGLHLRSGLKRQYLAELHGNMFVEACDTCEKQYIRPTATTSVGQKYLGKNCCRAQLTGRVCRGKLRDTILDWEANLPENDLTISELHSSVADLNICLGTTLQIVPSGNLPMSCKKYDGKVVIVNLQPTKRDKKADLIINTYIDVVTDKIMKKLGLEIPEFIDDIDPTRNLDLHSGNIILEWTLFESDVAAVRKLYDLYCKNYKKRKVEIKAAQEKLKKQKLEAKKEIKVEDLKFKAENDAEIKVENGTETKVEN